MKLNTIKWMANILLFTTLVFSCKKGYFPDGFNDDPQELKNPNPTNLLSSVLMASGYEYGGDESRFPAIFMQQVTGDANQSYSANIYNISPEDVDNMWTFGFYGGIMNNGYDLIQVAEKMELPAYHAIGQITMANLLMRATDLWGDIPYAKAFLGNASKNAPFDTQKSIYDSVLQYLNNGIAEIAGGVIGVLPPDKDDFLYGGAMKQWAKLAHALKARAFIHLGKQNPAYYDSVLIEIPLAFKSGEDDAKIPFSGSSINSSNPTYQFNSQRGDIAYRGKVYDFTIGKDPRFGIYFDTTIKFNKNTAQYDTTVDLASFHGSDKAPVYLMTFDELKFIEAEAQFQKGNKTLAALAYNSAVLASLTRTDASASYATTISKNGSNITLNDILTQKYIALFLSPEVWTDWRRTGLPALNPTPGNVTGGVIPRSLVYPSSEIRYNSNTPKDRTLSSRIWWDKP